MSETCTPSKTRAMISYLDFRRGFSDPSKRPPEWDALPDFVRDAILVAYAQGKLDAKAKAIAAEREACAKIAVDVCGGAWDHPAMLAAQRIRARGSK